MDRYASGAPAVLRRDFFNSLMAAFTEDEVTTQLARMNLTRLLIDVIDDRHWVVGGSSTDAPPSPCAGAERRGARHPCWDMVHVGGAA